MSAPIGLFAVRILHVVLGVFWVGSVLFIAAFLTPSIRAGGPGGGVVMQQIVVARRLPLWLMGASILTLLSGVGLYWHDSLGFRSAWLGSGPGRAFGLGGVFGLAASLIGMTVNAPTARRMGERWPAPGGRPRALAGGAGRDRFAADAARPGGGPGVGPAGARHSAHGGGPLRPLAWEGDTPLTGP